MKISRGLAIQILKYCCENKDFYFPFQVMCKEYTPEDNDFVEIEYDEWETISNDLIYQTFELWENLQNLYEQTMALLTRGFIEVITEKSLETHICTLATSYRKEYRKELDDNKKIEEYGLNEFIGGKADAYEDCLYLIRKYSEVSDKRDSIFME